MTASYETEDSKEIHERSQKMFAPKPPESPSEFIIYLILMIVSGTTIATQLFYLTTKSFKKGGFPRAIIINSVCSILVAISVMKITPQWSAFQHEALVGGILILANGMGWLAGIIENRINRKED